MPLTDEQARQLAEAMDNVALGIRPKTVQERIIGWFKIAAIIASLAWSTYAMVSNSPLSH